MKNSIVLSIALVLALFITGCVGGPSCPECPGPSTYSVCDDLAMKTRTNYRCDESTNYECESYTEETQCATEITLTGNIDVTITPTIEEKVQDIIRIEISGVPDDTNFVVFFLSGGDLPPISNERLPTPASNQGDVWTGLMDTTNYENGLYDIMIIASNEDSLEGDPQHYAQGQILISN